MRLMLQEATQRGYAMVYLFVFDDNLRAIRAYEKVGFVEAGERMDPKGMGRQLRMEYSLLSA
jgi:RimJ/RimL family protein N-acetyltransferase